MGARRRCSNLLLEPFRQLAAQKSVHDRLTTQLPVVMQDGPGVEDDGTERLQTCMWNLTDLNCRPLLHRDAEREPDVLDPCRRVTFIFQRLLEFSYVGSNSTIEVEVLILVCIKPKICN